VDRRLNMIGATVMMLFVAAACGGSGEGSADEAEAPAVTPAEAIDISTLTGDAARGEGLFASRGCIGCHTIGGGRLAGPDLEGVTERRERDWIFAMIINPDSMIKNDEVARELFAEYMTAMLSVGVNHQEAADLHAYLEGSGS